MTAEKKTLCLCHDTERGWGHLDVDPDFAALVDRRAPADLAEILRAESDLGVRVTYHVVACFLDEVRQSIVDGGHCVAFHSFDHDMDMPQLERCRQVDGTIKGYRTPRNVLTPDLSDDRLRQHGFEWLGSSARSFGFDRPIMENGIVKIPVAFDDFELYKVGTPYPQWEEKALQVIRDQEFAVIGLHDCYARFWLPHYRSFLSKIRDMGEIKTFDEVAAEVASRSLPPEPSTRSREG